MADLAQGRPWVPLVEREGEMAAVEEDELAVQAASSWAAGMAAVEVAAVASEAVRAWTKLVNSHGAVD
eukprot:CAMPEP_0197693526 /NCGR_PEP_ID=MMETSP1338-20131121/112624_1 /TAXON_ID=43686 ORGANISM="Pelagodinium beii, Strain RCC1491" /NCGR_SAMPLE_ID=MMETSP1338 /ASSEMBLY_ACC=CAM_ASM_000754 /LENGTH=67 /DNA_ID=CAMNT_0043276287 /DNA_START=761 /DNA_END=961 /DNA_ORIENTATION=-